MILECLRVVSCQQSKDEEVHQNVQERSIICLFSSFSDCLVSQSQYCVLGIVQYSGCQCHVFYMLFVIPMLLLAKVVNQYKPLRWHVKLSSIWCDYVFTQSQRFQFTCIQSVYIDVVIFIAIQLVCYLFLVFVILDQAKYLEIT